MTEAMLMPRVARADNDLLFDEDGRSYVDLFTGHGAVWLGHGNPAIAAALAAQLGRVWLTGGLDTAAGEEARARLQGFFPASHRPVALYSTGMEAAEFALRLARVATGRLAAAGFARSMHGKSLATACLAWDNAAGAGVPFIHRLPFLPDVSEDAILARLDDLLARTPVGAVLVEPVQGSGGGHAASPAFHRELARRCRERGTLLVFDEILTGFHRTGPAFRFEALGVLPDVILVGKALGNGFPVAAVVARRDLEVRPAMLPGSTYAGNPLAAAAVAATLAEMRARDLAAQAAAIEATVGAIVRPLAARGVAVRGAGALWILALPPAIDAAQVAVEIYRAGVAIGVTAGQLRVLPAATITPDNLARACDAVARVLTGAAGG